MVQKVLDYVDALGVAKLTDDEQDYINYGDEEFASEGGYKHWEPDHE